MADLIDVLSPSGLRTGEILPRAEIHRLGKLHRAIHLYLFNARGELLLQRRSLTVDHAPGVFSISVVGHLDAGEFSASAVRREVEEELGLRAAALQIDFLFAYYQEAVLNETYIDRQFNDVYVTRLDLEPERIQFDTQAATEIQFVPFDTFRALVADPASSVAPVYANELRDIEYFLSDWLAQP